MEESIRSSGGSLSLDWRDALNAPRFAVRAGITLSVYFTVLWIWGQYVTAMESRVGVSLPDPLLAAFSPVDVTHLTFALTYGLAALALALVINHPKTALIGLQASSLVVLCRIVTIYAIPLEPPAQMIPLADPMVEMLVSDNLILTKDLFFSGHTANTFLFFLVVRNRHFRPVLLLGSVLVGALVLLQHVHYTIDVLAAPVFAYACYRFAVWMNRDLA